MDRDARQTGRLWRWLAALLGFVLAAVLTFAALALALQRAEVAAPVIQADVASGWMAALDAMRAGRARGDVRQIAILGDSMLMPGEDQKHGATLPERLDRLLARRQRGTHVYPIAAPGTGYQTFYYFAGELAEIRPDRVLIEINPLVFAKSYRTGSWARADLVGWLGAERVPGALALPLDQLAITADELLWKVACVELGCAPAWGWLQREQLRVVGARDVASGALSAFLGWRAREALRYEASMKFLSRDMLKGKKPARYSAEAHRRIHGAAFSSVPASDPAIALTAATVRDLRAAGIPVLVYVTPINVDHLREVGVYDEEGYRTTARHCEEAVVAAGGEFLDLHDLLPDAAFRDANGHLTITGPTDGTEIVAERLAAELGTGLRELRLPPRKPGRRG